MLKKLIPHSLAVLLILAVVLSGCGGGKSSLAPPSWKVVGTPGFSDPAENPSIAIAGNGVPYVVYRESNSGKVMVMKFDGTNWITVGSPGSSGNQIGHISIAIAGNGVPYVVYPDSDNHSEATVKKFDGENWTLVGTAGFSRWSAEYPSIAIAGNGVPYVVYRDEGNGNKATVMKYAR